VNNSIIVITLDNVKKAETSLFHSCDQLSIINYFKNRIPLSEYLPDKYDSGASKIPRSFILDVFFINLLNRLSEVLIRKNMIDMLKML